MGLDWAGSDRRPDLERDCLGAADWTGPVWAEIGWDGMVRVGLSWLGLGLCHEVGRIHGIWLDRAVHKLLQCDGIQIRYGLPLFTLAFFAIQILFQVLTLVQCERPVLQNHGLRPRL